MGRFEGKVALITGASSGIGQTTAVAFAQEGAEVIICSRRIPEETMRMIEEVGGEVTFIQTDVAKSDQIKALFEDINEKFGRLDYAINNAGVSGPVAPLMSYPEEDFDQIININLKGVWLCMKYQIEQMLKQEGGGSIVNIASVAGLIGSNYGVAPYTASKHGVVGLTKAGALEVADKGIRINVICPGVIETPLIDKIPDKSVLVGFHPMGRIGETHEVAKAALWLCSDEASFITGQSLAIDGGWTVG